MRRSGFIVVAGLLASLLFITIMALAGTANAREVSQPANDSQVDDNVALSVALEHITKNAASMGLKQKDVASLIVTDQYVSKHTGVTHIYLRQTVDGIEVYGGNANINIDSDGGFINMGNRLVANLDSSIETRSPTLSQVEAVQAAATQLELEASKPFAVEEMIGGQAQEAIVSDGGVSQLPIPVKLVFQPLESGAIRLAWDLSIYELSSEHWWSIRVDAVNGELLSEDDWVDSDSWQLPADVSAPTLGLANQNGGNLSPDSYNVFAIPKEHPNDGPRTLEVDPADTTASPYGWHDTDGSMGAEFTTTQGNNVHAYADRDADNEPDPGSSPDGGPTLVFSYSLDLTVQEPISYQPAAVTNLFYWNNLMHDVPYLYGFDEAAGNFQENNYGNPGLGGDYVYAEAQDGSGTNNANFATPPDGDHGRMQMYEWTPPLQNKVTVNAPPVLAGDYGASNANFGPQLSDTGPITGDVTLVDDGTGDTTDGCEPLVGFPAGDIALIRRGSCNFTVKVANAQAVSATAVIIMNNVPGAPITMGGTDPTITIPSVMIGQFDGDAFEDELTTGGGFINATLKDASTGIPNRDSDLDAGVIAHEYGHGISNRLTGGPSNAGCLNNEEQMGEGWSDLMTLFMTAVPTDTATSPRGIGTYVRFQDPSGLGIRLYPYSTDMNVNPQTYDSIITNGTSPHSLGEVWAAMVWEVYWNLVDKHGFNPDIYGDWTTGGNNLTMQLVMDGMKLQPCSPGFVDGRDAILLADQLLTGGANKCDIWEGFAKRGLGISAQQGDTNSRYDGVEAFDLPGSCAYISAQPLIQDVCAGGTVDYITEVGPLFTPPVAMSSSGEPAGTNISFVPDPVVTVPSTTTASVETTAGVTPSGTYTLTLSGTDAVTTTGYNVYLNVFSSPPGTAVLLAPANGATDQIYHPHFEWSVTAGATEFLFELATDAAFNNVIESAVVVGTEYASQLVLDAGETYYWRIGTGNACGSNVSEEFSFTTISGMCSTGTQANMVFFEDFETGGTGWSHSAPSGTDTWTITNTNPSPGSGGNGYHAEDLDGPGEQWLISPEIMLPSVEAGLTLQFLNEQIFEDPFGSGGCFDGGALEISTDGGANWTPLDSELLSDPYDGLGNNGPPAGVNLWCGLSGGFQPWLNSIADLDAYAGETVSFRYRMLSDAGVGAEGWYLDDVAVQQCVVSDTMLPYIIRN